MAQHPYTDLSPNDAAVAIRSFERRFRQAAQAARVSLDEHDRTGDSPGPGSEAAELDDREVDEVASRPGSDGHSALDHLGAARHRIEITLAAVSAALVSSTHVIDADLLGLDLVVPADRADTIEGEIRRLSAVAQTLADRVESADASEWTSPRSTSTGSTATPLAIVQTTVAFALDRLGAVESVLRQVRGRPR